MKSLAQIAHERLYPSLCDPNYLVLRARRLIFTKWIHDLNGNDLKILDVGGRYQPYRPLFDRRVGQYVAVDLVRTEMVSVVANGENLPFAPESFDVVITTQVMEYLSDPGLAVRRLHGLLKPRGIMLASVAAFAPTFDEPEKWRFTRSGVRSLFSPFSQVEIVPEVYSAGGLLRTLNLALNRFAHFEILRSIHKRITCPLINVAGIALEKISLTRNEQFTANYSVRAFKSN
ncbi:MAG TPA: class I SAM-dependent methyltransferase [Terriglobales bacterium]|nr:class I SAM-dependent methyltransferase [Terriglobales bacterium]